MKKFNLMLGMVLFSVLMISLVSAGWFTGYDVMKANLKDEISLGTDGTLGVTGLSKNTAVVKSSKSGREIALNKDVPVILDNGKMITYVGKDGGLFNSNKGGFIIQKAPVMVAPVGSKDAPIPVPNIGTITVPGKGNSTNQTNVTTDCYKEGLLESQKFLDAAVTKCALKGNLRGSQAMYLKGDYTHYLALNQKGLSSIDSISDPKLKGEAIGILTDLGDQNEGYTDCPSESGDGYTVQPDGTCGYSTTWNVVAAIRCAFSSDCSLMD